jgi:hypothetical protein
MPKLIKACADIEEYERLRTLGPNAGIGSTLVVKTKNPEFEERDVKRHEKWMSMVNSWTSFSKTKSSKIKSRVRKGVPDSDRRAVWNRLVQVHNYIANYPGLYESLASSEPRPDEKVMIEHFRTIELDLYRTFPEMKEFAKGTEKGEASIASLRRVLRAYAKFDEGMYTCSNKLRIVSTMKIALHDLLEKMLHFCREG